MLKPTSKTNQIGLTGQQFYGSSQAKKARQPSGANAPQPLANSGIPGTAGAQKPIGLQRPLTGMQSQPKAGVPRTAQYYATQTTPMSQPSKPDMGIFGPSGSNNRTAADEAYRSFSGPMIDKGPLVPNTSGNPQDYMQKLYGGPAPTPAMPKKPELDRFTDLGVDPSDYHNLKAGTVGPEEWDTIKKKAIQAQMDRFYGISPQRQQQLDADIARDRELAASAVADARRNLGFSGATIGDYTDRTNRQTDYYGQRRESMDTMNKRLDQAGGLQYRQASTGFGTSEQMSQDAASINALYGAEKEKQEAINAQQQAGFDAYQTNRSERDAEYKDNGMNPDAIRKDAQKLSGEFAAITKQRVAPVKFTDYVQQQIDSGRIAPTADVLKVIEANYGVQFNKAPSQQSGPSIQGPSLIDLARQKAADTREARGTAEAQQQGLERRREQAAAQAAYRSDAARLIGQGLSPQQAHSALARQQQMQDYYGAQIAPDLARAQAQLGTAQINALSSAYSTDAMADASKYQVDQMYKDKAAQRVFDALYPPQPKDKAAQGGATGSKAAGDPMKPIGSKAKQPENPRITGTIDSLKANKEFRANKPESFLQAAKHFEAQGLDPSEQAAAFGQLYEAEFDNPEVASGTIKNLTKFAHEQAKKKGSWTDSWGTTSRLKETEVLAQAPVFKILMVASKLTPEEIALAVYPEEFSMGTRDAFLPERRQRLAEVLGRNPSTEE